MSNEIWIGDKKGLIHVIDADSYEKKHNIEKKSVGHNTLINGIENHGGIVSRSNYNNDFTDVSPAFNFDRFVNYIKNEQFV